MKDIMFNEVDGASTEPFVFTSWEDSDNTSHDSMPFGPGINNTSSLSSSSNSIVSSPDLHNKLPNDSDTDDHSDNNVQQTNPKMKKKRIRTNRRLYPFPRIVKRDIRRMYPAMLANVMNSGDLSFLASFLSEFTTKRCKFIDHFPGSEEVQFGWNRSFEGVPSIMQYFSSFWNDITQSFIPDFHIKVRWAEVKQFLNQDHSELKCGLTFTGTPIFDLSVLLQQFFNKPGIIPSVSLNQNKKRKLPIDYKHTQTLYLTPDMDTYLESTSNDEVDLPLLTNEQGAQMMATFQRIFQSTISLANSGQSFLQSFISSSTKRSICYNGLVTFKLDGKCQIRSLEFGPEVQHSASNSILGSENISSKRQCTDFSDHNVNNTNLFPDNFSLYDSTRAATLPSSNISSQSYSLLVDDCLNFLDSMIDPGYCVSIPV